MPMLRVIFLLAVITTLLPWQAQAQSRRELAAQNAELAQRISVLESRLLTGDPAAERLMQRIDQLETAQRSLTGEVEHLRFERDSLKSEVEALRGDVRAMQDIVTRAQIYLDSVDLAASQRQQTFSNLAGGTGFGNQGVTDPTPSQGQPSSIPQAPTFETQTIPVQDQYARLAQLPAQGKQRLAEGDFVSAQSMFLEYVTALPEADDVGEINYWLAETHFVQGQYADAAERYISSMRTAPQGTKAPDSMIRLGASLRELGKTTEACQTFNSFAAQYPNAPAILTERVRTEKLRTGC